MNITTTTTHPRSRGIAMPLVLISIAIAVVIAGVALTTRDTTSAIGENAANTAKAKWAAESAANLSTAVIEKNLADWTDSVDSNLMTNVDLAGADVSVQIVNKDGLAPTPTDEELTMTIRATADGITREVTKEIVVTQPVDLTAAIDPMLGEFAIYATEWFKIQNASTVRVWPKSPSASVNPHVHVGGEYSSVGQIDFDPDNMHLVRFCPSYTSASTVIDLINDPVFVGGGVIPMDIPTYLTAWTTGLDTQPDMGDVLITGDGTEITLDAATDPQVRMSSLTISDGAKLIIAGDVEMYVDGWFSVDNGELVFADENASLRIFVGKNTEFINGALVGTLNGLSRGSAISYYHPADALTIVVRDQTHQSGMPLSTVRIKFNSLVKADIRALGGEVDVESSSVLIGRATASKVHLIDADLYYDTEMDNHSGFAEFDGPLYDQTTALPIDGLQTALDSYNWILGEDYFPTYISTRIADDPDAGTSGGVTVLNDLEGAFTSALDPK